jgi:hypothetical protein
MESLKQEIVYLTGIILLENRVYRMIYLHDSTDM